MWMQDWNNSHHFPYVRINKWDSACQFHLKFRPSEICALSPAVYLAQGNYYSANFTRDDESAGTA